MGAGTYAYQTWGKPDNLVLVGLLVFMGLCIAYAIHQWGWVGNASRGTTKIVRFVLAFMFVVGVPSGMGFWLWPPYEPVVKTTFTDDPAFTTEAMDLIQRDVDSFHSYLSKMGFSLPKDTAPIGVSQGSAFVASYSPHPNNSVYNEQILIPRGSVLRPRGIIQPYSAWLFFKLFFKDVPSEDKYEVTAHMVYSHYYADSFLDVSTSQRDWNKVLWQLRQEMGAEKTDKLLFFSYARWVPPDSSGLSFDEYFYHRLMSGADVWRGNWAERVTTIAKRNGMLPTQPQP